MGVPRREEKDSGDVFLTVRIDPELRDQLRAIADAEERTVVYIIRRTLRELAAERNASTTNA